MSVSQYPVPDGIRNFKRGVFVDDMGGRVFIECFQFGQVIVALEHGDRLVKLEVKTVELEGQALPANLLGYGRIDGCCCWCSLLLDHNLYLGKSPSELNLTFEGLAIVLDDEDE